MPIEELHKRKRTKNFIVLAALAAWMALIWIITMVKIANHG